MPAPEPFADWTLRHYLEQTASKTPTPGGGSVASIFGAQAAALMHMVVSYSLGKKSLAAHEPALRAADLTLTQARGLFLQLAEEDAQAYGLVNALMKLPESDPRRRAKPEGTGEWHEAASASIAVPRAVLALSLDLLRLGEELAPITNTHLRSDLAISGVMLEACARASAWNTRINLSLEPDPGARGTILADIDRAVAEAQERSERIERACG